MFSRRILLFLTVLFVIFTFFAQDAEAQMKLCGSEKQSSWLKKACTMKTESKPCLKQSGTPDWNDFCCAKKCSLKEIIDTYCCQTDECLNRCYPGKGYKMGSVY
ncbi:hypothetical protein L596_024467 [Steinernema carpocapsae]|uniref:WAP domain-containing protein n=1 Tax=Steinernema carpocapsae TaxID=34508 RepID=A0A4U5MGU4_STECR|nr:hypothetical protein L596_024467 [Steinernema carpocapsae]